MQHAAILLVLCNLFIFIHLLSACLLPTGGFVSPRRPDGLLVRNAGVVLDIRADTAIEIMRLPLGHSTAPMMMAPSSTLSTLLVDFGQMLHHASQLLIFCADV